MSDTSHILRPPVIAVMGHVDHGKSALLDYIRKTNVVASEEGGITQHVSAYEVVHTHEGREKRITFLDTPGHEAFTKIRQRGASVADIAILIVSAEEGVKPQTLDALKAIRASNTPFVVAINKIDKPNADVNRTKTSLIEHEVYLEGLGGDIPYNEISAKTGQGVNELLDTLLLVAEMEELSADPTALAEGVVIEANRDPKKGVAATLVIKNGTLAAGQYIVADNAMAPVRIFEDFEGNVIQEASFSSPIRVIGFDALPAVGSTFRTYERKKDAELAKSHSSSAPTRVHIDENDDRAIIPVILKADATGTLEAIAHELAKLENDRVIISPIVEAVGAVSEGDIQSAVASSHNPLVIAFNVATDSAARDSAQQHGIEIHNFGIIYKLSEWLAEVIATRTPTREEEQITAEARVLMYFSSMKSKHVLGGKVKKGTLRKGGALYIIRGDERIGEGVVANLQSGKQDVSSVEEGSEFGAQIETAVDLAVGDILQQHETITT